MAKKFQKTNHSNSFKDVAGCENAKREMLDVVEFLKNPEKFNRLGAELPKGVLMVGPPGTGKTLMARACAGEADVPFYSISGSEFIEVFVGVGASRVRDLFQTAKKEAPSIIFIDEIDAIGRARGTGLGGGHDEREQTLNQILSEMDGFNQEDPVIIIAATNRPDVLDPALIRPGRFDRQVVIDLPHREAREKIFQVHLSKVVKNDDINYERLAKQTIGFSGADIKNMVNEAALIAARDGKENVNQNDLELARDKIILGNPREEHINEQDKKIVAYHECGHALVAILTPGTDPVKKITIVPRGRALGFTEQLPAEEKLNASKTYLNAQISILLGGRIAEDIIFGDVTTGAEDDLKRATKIARKMVANYGMSEKVGLLSFQQGEEHRFLGKEIIQDKDFSEKTAQLIDEEVKKILDARKEYVHNLLSKEKEKLERMTNALLEKETLDIEEIKELIS